MIALFTCQMAGLSSLRDVESTLESQPHHRYHLGIKVPSRSALARANETLSYQLYAKLFQQLYQRFASGQRRHGFRFKAKLFSLDASLIDVSMKLFPWADFNRKKSAFKLHLGLDHDGITLSWARTGSTSTELSRDRCQCRASPHIAPRAVMIAPDFALLCVLATASIAPPMVEGACARRRAKDKRGRGQRVLYLVQPSKT